MYYNCLFRNATSYADNLNKDYKGEAYFGITDMAKAFTTTTTTTKPKATTTRNTNPTTSATTTAYNYATKIAFTKKDVTLYPDNNNPGI